MNLPMRMRKKPWVDTLLQNPPSFVHSDLSPLSGKTHDHHECVHLEIGSGKGDYWIQMSQKYPKDLWIGIEKETNVAAVAIKKALDSVQDNQLFIIGDAQDYLQQFAKDDIDMIHLNFSDPWPKKRTHKRRLSASTFIDHYKRVLSDQGQIIMKTDNQDLFEYSMVQFSQNGFILEEMSVDFRRQEHDDAISEYEARFMSLNQPIYRCIWRKKHHG
jgi:tRNA (guanine-N7-)-methyltransferase